MLGIGRDSGMDSVSPRWSRRSSMPPSTRASLDIGGVFSSPAIQASGLSSRGGGTRRREAFRVTRQAYAESDISQAAGRRPPLPCGQPTCHDQGAEWRSAALAEGDLPAARSCSRYLRHPQRDETQAGHLSAASRATALAELIDSRQADGGFRSVGRREAASRPAPSRAARSIRRRGSWHDS